MITPLKLGSTGSKIRFLLIITVAIFLIFYQAKNSRDIKLLSQNIRYHNARLEYLDFRIEPTRNYIDHFAWFQNGRNYYRVVSGFYIARISAIVGPSSVEITGYIANTDAITKNIVKISAAIKNSEINSQLVYGETEISYLPSGLKLPFNIIIPSKIVQVDSIAISITEYRM